MSPDSDFSAASTRRSVGAQARVGASTPTRRGRHGKQPAPGRPRLRLLLIPRSLALGTELGEASPATSSSAGSRSPPRSGHARRATSRNCARGRGAQGPRLWRDRRPLRGTGRASSTSRPCLVGHSFGGLTVELLLDLVSAGRASPEPCAPKGHSRAALLRPSKPPLRPSRIRPGGRGRDADAEESRYGFVIRSPPTRPAAYERYATRDRPDLLRGGIRELPPRPPDRAPLQEEDVPRS